MDDPAIDGMLAIQVRRRPVANEERAAISIRSTIRHRKKALVSVSHPDLFIGEFGSVGAQSIDTIIVVHDLATLHHEAWNDTLEDPVPEMNVKAKLTRAQRSEIFSCPGQMILEKFHNDSAFSVALLAFCSNMNVHVDLHMIDVKVRHSCVDRRIIAAILTVHENFCRIGTSSFVLRVLCCVLHRVSKCFPMLAYCFVFRSKLRSVLIITHGIQEVTQFHIG